MSIGVRAAAVVVAATVAATLVSGCGANKPASEAGSFGDAAAALVTGEHTAAEPGNVPAGKPTGSLAENGDSTGGKPVEEAAAGDGEVLNQAAPTPDNNVDREADSGGNPPSRASDGGSTPPASKQPEQGTDSQAGTGANESGPSATPTTPTTPTSSPAMTTTTKPSPAAEPADRGTGASSDASAKTPSITWAGFFDNEDQTTPSEKFWDLSDERATVRIKGFMGEVLSISGNWFLLIPEPGAECPFDNGDETYWNKIMIVFVKDGTKLRYTSKPLELTGRLDVGIKVDESGYKTMFRLYDATFKEIKA